MSLISAILSCLIHLGCSPLMCRCYCIFELYFILNFKGCKASLFLCPFTVDNRTFHGLTSPSYFHDIHRCFSFMAKLDTRTWKGWSGLAFPISLPSNVEAWLLRFGCARTHIIPPPLQGTENVFPQMHKTACCLANEMGKTALAGFERNMI